jgi:hypothetical protein
MTQYRHLYWNSGNKDLRQFSDTELEVLSYFLRKRYAYLLNTVDTTPGWTGMTQPDATSAGLGSANNGVRSSGSHTETDDNTPTGGAEPDTSFSSDQTFITNTQYTRYQNINHTTGVPDNLVINTAGILYWTSPDLKIGPVLETDVLDTLASHCLTQMQTGDEVGSYRVSVSAPNTASGITGGWVDKGSFFVDSIYGNASYNDYRLWLKTANTTEPSTPDNYVRWDASNNEIQLESSVLYSAASKIWDDHYDRAIYRNCPLYNVSTTNSGTHRGTFYDKKYDSYTNVLSGPSGGVYTRTYTPSGSIVDNNGPYYFVSPGLRTP